MMNSCVIKWLSIVILLNLYSCSTCYRYTNTSSYLIRTGKIVYKFTPKYEYYEFDYTRTDTLLYIKKVIDKSNGDKIKYNYFEGEALVYKIKDENVLIISDKIGDTTKNTYCLSLIYSSFWDGSNLCGLNKFANHYDAPSYKYWYVKDTLIYTNKGLKDCFVAYSALVEDKKFFIKFPIQWYIEKETGIPLVVRYPYCRDEESSSSWHLRYDEITLYKEVKFLFLNKKRQLWL